MPVGRSLKSATVHVRKGSPLSIQANSQNRGWQAYVLNDTACGCVDKEKLAWRQSWLFSRPNIRHEARAKQHLCYTAL